MLSVLEVALYPQSTEATLLGAAPGFLFTGTLFVLPAALLAAATLWLVRSGRLAITPLTAAFGIVIAGLWRCCSAPASEYSAAARSRSHSSDRRAG